MYQSLYRKYRPDSFEKVIGQDHITTTLVNQIRTGTIAHAYLLTGTRGTGKTSVARIFARAINCLSPRDGSPCGECEVCRKLLSGASLDVVEIDAASNNSVDDARSIRDSVRYAPIDCKYKVYIIDEVHQLSTAAFNALLKTLEEPPAHAVFILATTEVQKIPATILSRCLRLDFHLVPQNILEDHVRKIFDLEGVQYTEEGIAAIATAGEGSVRDTLSVADMCVSYSDKVDYDCVLGVLGANDPTVISEIAFCTLSADVKTALMRVEAASALGKSIPLLTKDITRYFRDLNIIKHDPEANAILKLPDAIYQVAAKIADMHGAAVLMRALDIFSEVEAKERYSMQPKILLENAIIKTATLAGEDMADVVARLQKLELLASEGAMAPKPSYSALKQTVAPSKYAPQTTEARSDNAEVESIPEENPVEMKEISSLPFDVDYPAPISEDMAEAESASIEEPNDGTLTADDVLNRIPDEVKDELLKLRGRILGKLRDRNLYMVYMALRKDSTLIKAEPGKIILAFTSELDIKYCNVPAAIAVLKEIFHEELEEDFEFSFLLYGVNTNKPGTISNADILKLFSSADRITFRKNNSKKTGR